MASILDNQTVHFHRLALPQGIDLNTPKPSLEPVEGTLAYDLKTGSVYFSDGIHWFPLKYDTSLSTE